MKKIALVLCALMISVSLFAAGGRQNTGSKATVGADGRYSSTVTIRLGRPISSNPRLLGNDTYTNNAYTREIAQKLNVTFIDEFESIYGQEYDRLVSLAIASGDIPDIMPVSSEQTLRELIDGGLIADLTDAYNTYASPVIKAKYDSYDGRVLSRATIDGKLMALPGTVVDGPPLMVWIRQDWVDKLGLVVDQNKDRLITLSELESIARAFITRNPGGSANPVGIALTPEMGDDFVAFGAAFGAYPNKWFKNANGRVYYGSTTAETKNMITQFRTWFEQGILDPQFGTRVWEDIDALLINGQLGIVPGQWHMPDWRFGSVRTMDNNAVFAAYSLSDNNGRVLVSRADQADRFNVVSKKFQHPELLIKIANILFDDNENNPSPEIIAATTSDNTIRPLYLELFPADQFSNEYQEYVEILRGDRSINNASTASIKASAELILNYTKNPSASPVIDWSRWSSRMSGTGLLYDLERNRKIDWVEPVFYGQTPTLVQRGGNLKTLQVESFVKIITGAEPVSYFDTFVSRWRSEGGDLIINEIESYLK
jgi:putative aldouronate transport system substrate-binding protein